EQLPVVAHRDAEGTVESRPQDYRRAVAAVGEGKLRDDVVRAVCHEYVAIRIHRHASKFARTSVQCDSGAVAATAEGELIDHVVGRHEHILVRIDCDTGTGSNS